MRRCRDTFLEVYTCSSQDGNESTRRLDSYSAANGDGIQSVRGDSNHRHTLTGQGSTSDPRPFPGRGAESPQTTGKEQRSPQELQDVVASIVLEETVGEATFFWSLESNVSKLILKPQSISRVLQKRKGNTSGAEGDGGSQHIERVFNSTENNSFTEYASCSSSGLPSIARLSVSYIA